MKLKAKHNSVKNNREAAPKGAAFLFPVIGLLLCSLTLSSCATKEQVVKVEERVSRLESGKSQSALAMKRIDSLAAAASKDNTGDYARVASLIQAMSDRIDELTNNVADLQERLQFVQSRQGTSGGDASASGGNTAANNPGVDCAQLYDDSFILVRKAEYESARAGFADYLQYCKNSALADNAQYWIAESYYSLQQYTEAVKEFTTLTDSYKDSDKRATAFYKLGRCSEELGKNPDAIQYYTAILTNYPSSNEAQLAKGKLAELAGDAKNNGGK